MDSVFDVISTALASEASVSSGAIVVAAKETTDEGGGFAGSGGGVGSIKGIFSTQTSFLTGISVAATGSVFSTVGSSGLLISLSTGAGASFLGSSSARPLTGVCFGATSSLGDSGLSFSLVTGAVGSSGTSDSSFGVSGVLLPFVIGSVTGVSGVFSFVASVSVLSSGTTSFFSASGVSAI